MFVLSVMSCASNKTLTDNNAYRDTVCIERYYVDSLIVYKADSATLKALFECDSLGNVLMTELATSQGQRVSVAPQVRYVNYSNGGYVYRKAVLTADIVADSLQARINILEEQLRSATASDNQLTAEQKKPAGQNLKWILCYIAVIVIGLAWIINKLIKIK